MPLGTVVLTGAAGRIGSRLREPLHAAAGRLVSVDRADLPPGPGDETHVADLADTATVAGLIGGADAVVHLAGVPDEAPLEDLVAGNVLGTHHVLEAARRTGVPRVVIASSNRLTGFHPMSQTLDATALPRPDGLYGASKVAVEALGSLYADKFGLDVVCLRIGTFEPEPSEPRSLATWLSPRDCAGFVIAALTVPSPGFLVSYAVSANARSFWKVSEELGYRPQDDAETYAGHFPGADAYFAAPRPQGDTLASPEFTLPHLR
ncbi:NAD-dependent epimerase/dehydratase family protein [Actinomadura parmotrematis]|uniref:NAD(P)-dependent oxidoreductase n=1 Tax=Actinomadura parmotrematis TaxID=2864039 RepID=A0ABS7FPG9_9ACTN|nr:NAD(P)-dependent oxidoreductase [Actinomadura parmotrematis]MBW8482201.1 NAD(P)-dependent oxidoreductase [Actinomadura parmotrematis]